MRLRATRFAAAAQRRAGSPHWLSGHRAAKTRAMITVILVIHLMLAASLTGVILVQKSEGGALGMGGGGMGGFMSGRSAANLLTRTTAIIAAGFFATSIALALISTHQRAVHSIVDTPPASSAPAAPSQLPAPAAPTTPVAPLAK
jgi:preprotein translocase subunit SecG